MSAMSATKTLMADLRSQLRRFDGRTPSSKSHCVPPSSGGVRALRRSWPSFARLSNKIIALERGSAWRWRRLISAVEHRPDWVHQFDEPFVSRTGAVERCASGRIGIEDGGRRHLRHERGRRRRGRPSGMAHRMRARLRAVCRSMPWPLG